MGTPKLPARILAGGLFGSGTTPTGQSTSGGGLFGGNHAKPAGGGLFGSAATTPTNTNNLFGGGQRHQSNLFGGTTNTNPLLGGKYSFGSSTLGTSTFGGGQQPQQQQLTAGSLLSFRLAGGLEQQQSDPASQHANITSRIEGIYNAWNPASPQCRFQVYLLCWLFFFSILRVT